MRKFVFEGGRLLLAGDTRVWRYYNRQPVDKMPLNQISPSFEIQFLSNSFDSKGIQFQSHPAVEKLTLEDVIEIAGVDFCGLRLPDKAEVLIKSRIDNTPLAGIVTYGEGKILAIGDSSFIADNTIDLERSKFYKELIGWLTRESFFTKGDPLSRERSDEE